ncbi:ABC transporter ATP-binding protein [Rhodococcoides trifolii]|uniref:ABC transporter ATP-binding protein n=2 Tax=Rhodococcoides trifolii TaxID=908250 RepID=A0A917D4H5_9NOCA|nr:ABC transporter ATP-binding protein [Rhodococcus trifolii]
MAFGGAGLVVVLVGVITVTLLSAGADSDPVRTEDSTMTFPESPGSADTVNLDTRLYLPTTTPAPAVLLAHGFGGDKNSVDGQARDLASRGFVVLAYTARGFGASTGKISLDDPDREVADARGLVDYLSTRPDVVQDAPGDPRVGVAGGSYGGALALMLAGTDRRIDADAAAITWNDLGQSLFPNYAAQIDPNAADSYVPPTPAAATAGGTGVLKKGWAGVFFGAGALPSSGGTDQSSQGAPPTAPEQQSGSPDPCGRFATEFCAAYAQSAVTGIPSAETSALLTRHSPVSYASSITAPTLLVQGQQDSLFGLDQADATARQIAAAGGSVQVRWFDGGHDAGGTSPASDAEIANFLTDHLMGTGDTTVKDSEFSYSLTGDPTDQGGRAQRMTTTDYPGLAAGQEVPTQNIELTPVVEGPSQIVVRPPGATPSAISSIPGLGSTLAAVTASTAASALASDIPGQSASFRSEPLGSSLTITGTSTVDLTVGALAGTQQSVLFAKLYDVSPDGRRTLPNGLVSALRLPDNTSGTASTVRVALPGVGYRVPAGHHLEVTVSTTDQAYSVPLERAQFSVSLANRSLVVPSVPSESTASSVPVWPLIGIGILAALVAALVAAGTILGRRRTAAEVEPDLIDTPLVITDLNKTYSNGFKAVNGVSFTVEKGQVLGLLGPNGAGKTTTLRMLMGLMTPTSGDIRVFGHAVSPGSPVLSRLGSFIEGSGFLPHLSGSENLRLYWQATGRPLEDAHLEEAMTIADLGTAVERKVRSYSQGMRQRLAIAQAMLGLPDLMVLDEPTNGLDPPQIRTMRDVLINYARTGRTVLVSSHLLAEVEQTCTHVVVMNRGAVISSGTVQELIGGAGPTEFRLDPVDRGADVLRGIDGVGAVVAVPTDSSAVRADLGAVQTGDAVRALVDAGIAVNSVSRSTRLEDVFLDLVHDDVVKDEQKVLT